MGGHCAEARKVLRELDAELAASSERTGTTLVWTAADRAVLDAIAANIDRRVDLTADYQASTEPKVRVKLSAELRLLEGALARLLKEVHTDIPAPESQTTIKARRAANARWHPRHAPTG
ncbi:hypothetical protein [Mycolicibacterium pulveris]|nr:hypothetical protein [Mycolicibacterium pulveris]